MTERYDLELCTSSHASAEKEQTQVRELMQKMSKQDYMVHVEGGMSCAQQRFPTGELAIGKLGVASALGKEDRMIRDSSRGGASPSARFSERAEVPSLFLFTAALCRLAAWSGVPVNCKDRVLLSVDIKGATNQSALQQRTLVFRCFPWMGVCLWGRILQICCQPLRGSVVSVLVEPFVCVADEAGAFLGMTSPCGVYVDDFLLLLPGAAFTLLVVLVLAMLQIVRVPVSWRKLALG